MFLFGNKMMLLSKTEIYALRYEKLSIIKRQNNFFVFIPDILSFSAKQKIHNS